MTIGGRTVMGSGERIAVVQPHNHRRVLGDLGNATDAEVAEAIARRGRGGEAVAGAVLRRPRGRLPARGGPARRAVARHAERGDRARPVQVGLPGRDRRRLRADRLLAVQRRLRQAAARRAARVEPGHLEPDGVPAARGVRARDHAVQLHRDRREPADRARPARQRGGVEAVADPAARGALHHGAADGGRAAARRDQHGDRATARRSPGWRCPTPTWPGFTSPARPAPSSTCGGRSGRTSRASATIRGSSARPAARTS